MGLCESGRDRGRLASVTTTDGEGDRRQKVGRVCHQPRAVELGRDRMPTQAQEATSGPGSRAAKEASGCRAESPVLGGTRLR